MEIRKIEPRDFAQVAQIENENWTLSSTPHVMNSSVEAVMRKVLNGTTYLLAVENGEILGLLDYAPLHPSEFAQHVVTFGLVTVQKARHKGIATQLLNYFIKQARLENFKKITIKVLSSNPEAISFYEHRSFAKEAELKSEFLIDGKYVNDLTYVYYLDDSILL